MIKKITYLLALPSLMLVASCATTNETAQRVDQNDDVYYSVAQAREGSAVLAQTKPESAGKNYVTDEELYGDASGGYYDDYAGRIYRFRNYAPWRGYYDMPYSGYYGMYNYYDPFSPFGSFRPGLNINVGIGNGYFNNFYNPWRFYGFNNYGSNFWGPYSYYNNMWSPYGVGYGGYLGGGYYGGAYSPGYVSPDYRARPGRASNDGMIQRTGAAGATIRNPNGEAAVPSRGTRAERYNGGNPSTRPANTSGTRPQTPAPRPARATQPERATAPERINSAPSNYGGGNSGGRSNDGGSSGGSRPSRGN